MPRAGKEPAGIQSFHQAPLQLLHLRAEQERQARRVEKGWSGPGGECGGRSEASRPNNNCVLGKQFCSRGLFIGMFFLSTPFPHLLSFVLKGAWQFGKGLQAMHRKLWNTMNGAGTDPHPPKKVTCSSIQRPWGRQLELRTASPLLLKKATCPKRVMNRVKLEGRRNKRQQDKINKMLG